MNSPIRSGILLIDKPEKLTSADVVNKIKKRWNIARIGHGGTLDPFATGLLVILVEEATKVARFLLEGEKEYEAIAKIGEATNTGDNTGEIISTSAPSTLSVEDWQKIGNRFLGKIQQVPHSFSAVKFKGKALYEYARQGEVITVPPREVEILKLNFNSSTVSEYSFSVACSGGTYIRVLAEDMARSAGTCAHLTALRRTRSSSFRLESAHDLEKILHTETKELPLIPVSESLSHLPKVNCESKIAEKVRQGNLAAFEFIRSELKQPGYFLLVSQDSPIAICNHNPTLVPFCSIERVFSTQL